MTQVNIDQMVEEGLKKVADKKAELKTLEELSKRNWVTTKVFDGEDISKLNKVQVLELGAKIIHSFKMHNKVKDKLDIRFMKDEDLEKLNGFTQEEWFADLQKRLDYLDSRQMKLELEEQEKKLKSLQSEEVKKLQAVQSIQDSLSKFV